MVHFHAHLNFRLMVHCHMNAHICFVLLVFVNKLGLEIK